MSKRNYCSKKIISSVFFYIKIWQQLEPERITERLLYHKPGQSFFIEVTHKLYIHVSIKYSRVLLICAILRSLQYDHDRLNTQDICYVSRFSSLESQQNKNFY